MQNLDSNRTLKPRVPRLKDRTHSSGTDRAEDFVGSKPCARIEQHGSRRTTLLPLHQDPLGIERGPQSRAARASRAASPNSGIQRSSSSEGGIDCAPLLLHPGPRWHGGSSTRKINKTGVRLWTARSAQMGGNPVFPRREWADNVGNSSSLTTAQGVIGGTSRVGVRQI